MGGAVIFHDDVECHGAALYGGVPGWPRIRVNT
jgi:hypothetical protein